MNLPVISMNGGYMTPKIDVRSDTEKYSSGCRILENLLPLIYGPAERRPGTEYIATAKNSPEGIRLIPFIYSATIAYMVEFGDLYARFYYDGARVLTATDDIVEIATPYLVADLPQLQYKQSADVMWIVHGSYPQQKLSRTSASAFSMDKIIFTKGPFLERNDIAVEDDVTLTSSVTDADATGTLTASSATNPTFVAGHIGSIWKLTHKREDTEVKGSATTTGVIDAAIDVKGSWTFNTHGNWDATVEIQRCEDGTNWETFRSYTSVITDGKGSRNVQKTDIEESDGVQYRMNVTAYTSGTVEADLTVNNPILEGIVRIDTITSTTVANITVLSKVASTDATKRWAEGAWSGVRGYPTSFTFFEERAVYAGSTNNARRLWLSKSGEFENFETGTKDADSFELDLPTANTIRWVASLDALMVGTSGDEWRIRSTSIDAALTPTNFDIRQQTARGCRNIQALEVNEAVLFVDYVGRKVRELTYSENKQKFVSPDLTALAEDITENGITSFAHQRNPDSIVWFTLADGTLLSMTYEREQNVVAWAKHLIGLTQVDSSTVDTTTYEPPHYPLLRELTEAEIPSKPVPFTDTALSGETEITTKAGLQAITGNGHYKIMNDIDASGSWTPIADFGGVLDGGDFTISNLTIDAATSDDQGMFSNFATGAEIRYLNLSNFSITGQDCVGALVGKVDTIASLSLKNITIQNATIVGRQYIGGLIGYISTVTNLYIFECDESGSTITSSGAGSASEVGGLLGRVNQSASTGGTQIVDCSASATINANKSKAGGLIGFVYGGAIDVTIHTCSASGTVTCTDDTQANFGGLIGYMYSIDMTTCYATGDIAHTHANPVALTQIGGCVGVMAGDCVVINCYATGSIEAYGSSIVGGFVGKIDSDEDTNVNRCYATGDIYIHSGTGYSSVYSIGGFIGMAKNSADAGLDNLIQRSWAEGDIRITEGDQGVAGTFSQGVGGFIGKCGTAATYSGGVGIQNCYSWSSISSDDDVSGLYGGFAGNFYSEEFDWQITNCYDAQTDSKYGSSYTDQISSDVGTIAASSSTGGFLGKDTSTSYKMICTACYWDGETSGLTTDYSEGALEKTTAWLMTKSNFEDAGWDMDDIWELETATNYVQQEGTGTVESVATIPGEDEDEVWVAVLREIGASNTTARFIERMKPRIWGTEQADCFFVDCGLSYDGTATDTFTGLDHLEGETVAVLGDGAVYDTETVTDGSITIRDEVEVCHVGLPFRYRLKPMRLDVMTQKGTTHGSIKKISEMVISFLETLNAQYGDGTDTRSIDWRTTEVYDTPPALFTGDKTVVFPGGFSIDDPILISGEDPLPCSVRAIVPRIEVTGR